MTTLDFVLGALGKPVEAEWSVQAHVRVKAGVLSRPENAPTIKLHRDPAGDYWAAFLRLAELDGVALDRGVAAIARKWGTLGLCDAHGLPSTHPPEATPGHLPETELRIGSCPLRISNGRIEESTVRWRDLSRQAGAILTARTNIRDGAQVPRDHLVRMAGAMPFGITPPGVTLARGAPGLRPVEGDLGRGAVGPIILRTRVSRERAVSLAVGQWLAMSDVTTNFKWDGEGFALGISTRSFFGALTLRLAGDLQSARPLVRCDYCSRWYRQRRTGTFFCRSEACDRLRQAENQRRRRAGKARTYKPRTTTPGEGRSRSDL